MKVVVPSCDGHSWLIPTFLHFYKKNWSDNPYQTEFVTETKEIEGHATFCTGKIPWTDGIIKYLKSFNEETFLLLLADFILEETVSTDMVKRAESLCVDNIGCVRLIVHDRSCRFLVDTGIRGFKRYPLDKPFSVSLQASIWQKEFLLEILRKGENPWQTEIEGSKRIQQSRKKVIWTDAPILSYHYPHGYLAKGEIVRPVEQWVKENW